MQTEHQNLHTENRVCMFCSSAAIPEVGLPDNIFNGINYGFLRCERCDLLFLSKTPGSAELNLMYSDSYQDTLSLEHFDIGRPMPGMRFSYEKQFELIRNYCKDVSGLDFGCGNGHFIYHANRNGIKFDGMEFTDSVVLELRNRMPGINFMNKQEFDSSNMRYDLIRLSNVLEHFTDPGVQFQQLLDRLKPNGFVLIEGPLETNASLVNWFKWWYFRARKLLNRNYTTSYPPYHIFFSNYRNQLRFFASFGLKKNIYESKEDVWPYTSNWKEVNSAASFVKYLLAKASLIICKIIPRSGNTFIYVGQKT